MLNLIKITWNILLTISAMIILIGIYCYMAGETFNPVIIGFFLLGAWAIKRLSVHSIFGKYFKNIFESICWYSVAYIVIGGTIYIFAENTVLEMYKDWGQYNRSLWGALRIFAPIIVITIGSTYLAMTSEDKTFVRKLITVCVILSSFGLALYGLVNAADKFLAAKKKVAIETLDANRLNTLGDLGLFASTDKDDTPYYKEKFKNLQYECDGVLEKGKQYYTYRINEERQDGPHKLIRIYLPDRNGDVNGNCKKAWVRLTDITISKKNSEQRNSTDQTSINTKTKPKEWKTVFEKELKGKGYNKEDRLVSTIQCKDTIYGDKILITGDEFEIWYYGEKIKFQNSLEIINEGTDCGKPTFIRATKDSIIQIKVKRFS